MSRARDWTDPRTGIVYWFDAYNMATTAQIELLADVTGEEIDDLLEENLSARAVLYRLNEHSKLIPHEVIERKRERLKTHPHDPVCRICPTHGWECEGRITRHHFVPRWLMLELKNYNSYAPRSFCTIPVCSGRHRDLHLRTEEEMGTVRSIAPYLTPYEKSLVAKLISELKVERPVLFNLLASGDRNSYEYQLVRDWEIGLFSPSKKDRFKAWLKAGCKALKRRLKSA